MKSLSTIFPLSLLFKAGYLTYKKVGLPAFVLLYPPSSSYNLLTFPFVIVARIVLNYKAIPYTTSWTEYPDIAPTLSPLGVQPNSLSIAS